MTQVLDGKKIAGEIRQEIKKETGNILKERNSKPGLAVIIAGEDPASAIYVRNKEKAALEVGYHSVVKRFPAEITQDELLAAVDEINQDEKIHGMIVQLPLPKHINEKEIINRIDPKKDVDGLHPASLGALVIGDEGLVSCTPKGCIRLIKETGIDIAGKKAVVLGRSNMVGKPVALLLLQENATVTICHSRTKNLKEELLQADIIVAAVGLAKLVKKDMVKKGAVIIDVGINRSEDGKLCGDVDFDEVFELASFITPVPGGVGPMTIAMLLSNTLEAFYKQTSQK